MHGVLDGGDVAACVVVVLVSTTPMAMMVMFCGVVVLEVLVVGMGVFMTNKLVGCNQ